MTILLTWPDYPDAFSQDITDDLQEHFRTPPAAYGPIPFYWWTGEKLSVSRIEEQLDRLEAAGFSGVNVNYTHTAPGYTYLGDPPLFSEDWWDFWSRIVEEAAERGMFIGFDDYLVTHGSPELAVIGSKISREAPEVAGQLLRWYGDTVFSGRGYSLNFLHDKNAVSVRAYRMINGNIDQESAVDLLGLYREGQDAWKATEDDWYVSILYTEKQPFGAMNPLYAQKVLEYYFREFEKHDNGKFGETVNYFFQDELTFGGSMPYWSPDLPERFRQEKGYNLLPELSALFFDLGPRTVKIRLDYYDVAVQMMEEAYFKPIFEWCREKKIIYGHDQMARADVIGGVKYYGDYFRTLRWYQAPGTDRMPVLLRGKVASSISHLYHRPRTWFEAYHSTGWGVTPAHIMKWDYEALIYGYNLFSYHSCYYTTLGGWWEWAPGDITFRQPWFTYFTDHYSELRRLCYLLSQGTHQCDVAILFPTSTVQADMEGSIPGDFAREARDVLHFIEPLFKEHSIDFIFMDDQSVAHASTVNGNLNMAGGSYKIVILPSVRYIRIETLQKLVQFFDHGGKIIALGSLPVASNRAGSQDPVLDSLVEAVFGEGALRMITGKCDSLLHRNENKGAGYFLRTPDPAKDIVQFITSSVVRDFSSNGAGIQVMHRRTPNADVFALYNPKNEIVKAILDVNVVNRRAEVWDAKTGEKIQVFVTRLPGMGSRIETTFDANEFKIIVFREGSGKNAATVADRVILSGEHIDLDTVWTVWTEPLLDNSWGDFYSPACDETVGAETRKFRYRREYASYDTCGWTTPGFDDADWQEAVISYGPRFFVLGPIGRDKDCENVEKQLLALNHVDINRPVRLGDDTLCWHATAYSLRRGIFEDPVLTRQTGLSPHGPIGYVPDEMIHLVAENDGDTWYVWTSVHSDQPENKALVLGTRAGCLVWLNGKQILKKDNSEPEVHVPPWQLALYPYETGSVPARLNAGSNSIVLKVTAACNNSWIRVRVGLCDHFKVENTSGTGNYPPLDPFFVPSALVAAGSYREGLARDFDCFPVNRPEALWYRFVTPPGTRSMIITAHGHLTVWMDGREARVRTSEDQDAVSVIFEGAKTYYVTPDKPVLKSSVAVIRIEPLEGFYGGAAIPEPIRYSLVEGQACSGDWSGIGLENYSGAIRYAQSVSVDQSQAVKRAVIDLGDVACAAKVWVNGNDAGCCYHAPWRFDISGLLVAGENRIEISVANTLANHYSTGMPAGHRYVFPGQERSGLLGPVKIHFLENKK
jgi:hypothetical protein